MANVTFGGEAVQTVGNLPAVGTQAPDFVVVGGDLQDIKLSDYAGKRVVLNFFPSLDTGTCAASVRRFNKEATSLENTQVLGISKDLPFAQARFCTAEGIDNVVTGSAFRSSVGEDYGITQETGPLAGLLSRAVVVVDENGTVIYTEQVAEIHDEPDYEAALAALNN